MLSYFGLHAFFVWTAHFGWTARLNYTMPCNKGDQSVVERHHQFCYVKKKHQLDNGLNQSY